MNWQDTKQAFAKRNAEIFKMRQAGHTFEKIRLEFNLTNARVQAICKKLKNGNDVRTNKRKNRNHRS